MLLIWQVIKIIVLKPQGTLGHRCIMVLSWPSLVTNIFTENMQGEVNVNACTSVGQCKKAIHCCFWTALPWTILTNRNIWSCLYTQPYMKNAYRAHICFSSLRLRLFHRYSERPPAHYSYYTKLRIGFLNLEFVSRKPNRLRWVFAEPCIALCSDQLIPFLHCISY